MPLFDLHEVSSFKDILGEKKFNRLTVYEYEEEEEEEEKLLRAPTKHEPSIQQKFNRFLTEHSIKEQYKYNFLHFNLNGETILHDFLIKVNPKWFIFNAFIWNITSENHIFWSKIDKTWKEALKELKNE